MTINLKYLLLIIAGLFLWLTGIFLIPVLASAGPAWVRQLANWGYFFYHPVCHQIADRSFAINGFPMAVCIRCLAVYMAGFFLCLGVLRTRRISPLSLPVYLLLLFPAISDFIMEKIMPYQGLPWLRFVTGFFMGVALFHLILLSVGTPASHTKNLYRTNSFSTQ